VVDSLKFLGQCFLNARKLKKRSGLDLIVCYDPLKTGLFGVLIKAVLGGKLIIEVNGVFECGDLYFKQGLSDRLKRAFYPKLQQWVLNRADAVKHLFDGQLDDLNLKRELRRYKFFNYTDVVPREYSNSDSKTILSAGFPSHIKGLDLLIEAFLGLSSEYPDWKLVLLGHFNPKEIEKMQGLISANKNIELRRPVPFSDMPNVIDSCSILVLASRTEAMGRVLLEAMARSKPRIGSNVDGIPSDQVDLTGSPQAFPFHRVCAPLPRAKRILP